VTTGCCQDGGCLCDSTVDSAWIDPPTRRRKPEHDQAGVDEINDVTGFDTQLLKTNLNWARGGIRESIVERGYPLCIQLR
jgi:hypothetical protein